MKILYAQNFPNDSGKLNTEKYRIFLFYAQRKTLKQRFQMSKRIRDF